MKNYKKKMAAGVLAGFMMLAAGCGSIGNTPAATTTSGRDGTSAGDLESTEEVKAFSETDRATQEKTKQIEKIIEKNFYFDVDPERREESYYDGIMAGLDDPYSVYYTPEELSKLMEEDSGEYVGIGATVSKNMETNLIYVVKPLRGSPAEEVGVLPNDVFVKVDDTEITLDMELDDVVKMIRGVEGTTAHITFYREGEPDYIEIDIPRRKVQNITVSYEMLQDRIGYLEVEQFIDNTPEQFIEGVDKMIAEGAKALIIDLRNNPGGMLSSVITMADYLIQDDLQAEGAEKPGVLLQTKNKNGDVIEEYSCEDGHNVLLPMAVLVNGNSASASEILTGCLKDYKLAQIVGNNTYGKGIVQQIIPLTDGSAIKLTIAKYFTPSGTDIHKLGIAPNTEIDLDEAMLRVVTIPHDKDNQLQKAIELLGGTPIEIKQETEDTTAEENTEEVTEETTGESEE